MEKLRKDRLYLIKTQADNLRRIIVCSPDECFVLERTSDKVSIWYEGLTASDGKSLVQEYLKSMSSFNAFFNRLVKENSSEGGSECGEYTREEFDMLLSSVSDGRFGIYSGQLFEILMCDDSVGIDELE